MSANRPFVLTIAGLDPSGGAGILSDIKTFEQHRVYGLAITTGNTIQTENQFYMIQWTDLDFVLDSIKKIFRTYDIKAVKIGIIPSLEYLKKIVSLIKKHSPRTKIIWDTVLKSTTEFEFTTVENKAELQKILKKIDLITPNYNEILKLSDSKNSAKEIAQELSTYCSVLLKGGHHPKQKGVDYLFMDEECAKLVSTKVITSEKHGSGCVLSSAITANLALGHDFILSSMKAKNYIEKYLTSNTTLLGYHHV
ncbi:MULTISPECIES: hydroxymethylpyrimidine/phosphomethylpyrimidine kinase [Flavobacterium]|uniref:hydroxymethylpyrimidine/phosphomethylpyrimidine kinase n=1 Tax=Flavobacterium TaxID=237 RepID=UPI001FCB94AE|nr:MULTISPECIES: hydroxymethylpyrimidine/phosphomethylpyrimidine kinase [Flavobacterium]UOK42869.1 hydroxymethylpyrimidine/phosphomethylpyrimidine kinase [Flavobacterium enshiense]